MDLRQQVHGREPDAEARLKRWSFKGKRGFQYPVSARLRRLAIKGARAHESASYAMRNAYFSLHDELFLEAWNAGELRARAWRS